MRDTERYMASLVSSSYGELFASVANAEHSSRHPIPSPQGAYGGLALAMGDAHRLPSFQRGSA